jgi:hypothetical protein
LLSPHLDERGRRLFAASEAPAAGHGGDAQFTHITQSTSAALARAQPVSNSN